MNEKSLTIEDREILNNLKNNDFVRIHEYANLSVIPSRTFMQHGGVANCVASQINLVHNYLHSEGEPNERY